MTAQSPLQRLQQGLLAQYPLFYVLCQEERRLEQSLTQLSQAHYHDDRPLIQWTSTRGFFTANKILDADLRDPVAAIHYAVSHEQDAFYLFKDLPAHLENNPQITRALRDAYNELLKRHSYLFLSYPLLKLPDALRHQIFVVEFNLPDLEEILEFLYKFATKHELLDSISEDHWFLYANALKGMALNEIYHLLLRLLAEKKLQQGDDALHEINAEKAKSLLKEGCLRYIDNPVDVAHVGGLENLKEWVSNRQTLFTQDAFDSGIPLPAGILFMGVSGCGKSMAAKVIASSWSLPLVRLDMNRVMSGAFGSPEYAFDRALQVAETMAPLVLWIDEMENSFGYDPLSGSSSGNSNIFSSFLTWMQEKPSSVFVVATANRIEKLPAEIIRKGRFDQLFFLDLPTDEERKAIFGIHIKSYGADPAGFNMNLLAVVTTNWSGAEIEQAVKAARIRAYQENRQFTETDITWNTARMVPLAKTMEEQIKQLRQWATTRATPASRKQD